MLFHGVCLGAQSYDVVMHDYAAIAGREGYNIPSVADFGGKHVEAIHDRLRPESGW